MALRSLLGETQKLIRIASGNSSFVKDDLCKSVFNLYSGLPNTERHAYLKDLSKRHNCWDLPDSIQSIHDSKTQFERMKKIQNLRQDLTPSFRSFFISLGQNSDGIKFLIDLRSDIYTLQRIEFSNYNSLSNQESALQSNDYLCDGANLRLLDRELKDLLSIWFSSSLFQLRRITWDSPCSTLQKISDLEGVHRVRNWTDLKRRVGPYRRCYVYTHPCMPEEPVVILHTALLSKLSNTMEDIVHRNAKWDAMSVVTDEEKVVENDDQIKAAIFYSVTSPHKGLNGIDLGHSLIKRVVGELQVEYPHLDIYSTLSPVIGFRSWLQKQMESILKQAVVSRILGNTDNSSSQIPVLLPPEDLVDLYTYLNVTTLKDLVAKLQLALNDSKPSWLLEGAPGTSESSPLATVMTKLCARYLLLEKNQAGYTRDTVSNFHLRNGAQLWRINWLADTSARGLQASYGIMVNYRYIFDETETNSRNYLQNKEINASPQVVELVKGLLPSK